MAILDFPPTRPEQVALLKRAIAASGLSARRFASEKLIRNERTVRRWLAGECPIPVAVLQFLAARYGGG